MEIIDKVIIEISGGCVTNVSCPEYLEVIIVDYDNGDTYPIELEEP